MIRTILARAFVRAILRPTGRRPIRGRLAVESLEARDVPTNFHPTYVLIPHGGASHPFSSPGPTGTTPAQIRHAYGFDKISFANGTVAGDGSGTTIAIIDAYDDPNIASDLHQFDLRFGLPDPIFQKVNQAGGSAMPAADAGWAGEIALDVEWAHAIAPKAKILLVEANSPSDADLFAAVRYAAAQPGVVAVSMSFGGGEYPGQTTYDSTFKTPSGHAGVAFFASSGDSGAPASYPATSPNVLSVGGTTLRVDTAGNITGETGWSGSGGGISTVEVQPGYQKGVVTQTTTRRSNPDVAYDADPNTGFPVFDSYNNGTANPWSQYGGTSDAAPQWAALVGIADQGRALAGLGSLDGGSQLLPQIYSLSSADFHDVSSGISNGSPSYSAAAGYDLVTGRGSPYADRVVADLVGQPSSGTSSAHYTLTAPTSSTAGTPFTITVTAANSSGNALAGYTGTVHFASSDSAAGLPANYAFVSADRGVHTFTVTLKTAGSETLTASDTINGAIAGSATIRVSPAAAAKLAFGQQPSNSTPGAAITPAVTVQVLDAYGNVVTGDNTDRVVVGLANNPGGATLGGLTTATVAGGIATLTGLSVSKAGSGYTLTATSGTLTGTTSVAFNVAAAAAGATVIEDFESGHNWYTTDSLGNVSAYLNGWAAHNGNYGLDDYDGTDWIYRTDAAAQVKAGDTVSVWLKFDSAADGRAYFGFGAGSGGTLSLVAAPNTGQLIIQQNLGYGFTDLAAIGQGYLANHWYRLEVVWSTSGNIIGRLYDSNGTSLINSVSARTTAITSGGIAFRARGNDKLWDTVTVSRGVNSFAPRMKHTLASLGMWLDAFSPADFEPSSGSAQSHTASQEALGELYALRSHTASWLSAWEEFTRTPATHG